MKDEAKDRALHEAFEEAKTHAFDNLQSLRRVITPDEIIQQHPDSTWRDYLDEEYE